MLTFCGRRQELKRVKIISTHMINCDMIHFQDMIALMIGWKGPVATDTVLRQLYSR